MVVRTKSLRTQSARHRVDQPTISGRSCANSAHYKPLFACLDRTFVKSISSRRRQEKKSASPARTEITSLLWGWLHYEPDGASLPDELAADGAQRERRAAGAFLR